jgi:hypothetical protein
MATSRKKTKQPRAPHQRKIVQQEKSLRGKAETSYGECKKICSFSLTPTASNLLKEMSGELQLPMSELLERLARSPGTLALLQEEVAN